MYPRCCFTIPYTVESPSPVPRPGSFVVKKGSKRCDITSGAHPASRVVDGERARARPEAEPGCAVTNVWSSTSGAVSRIRLPPWGMASRALTARFTITCSSCPGSADTRPAAGSSRRSSWTSSADQAAEHGGEVADQAC